MRFGDVILATGLQHQLLNGAVLLAVFIPSVALGLAIRRARRQKAIRESDPNAPAPLWLTLKASGLELAEFRTRLAALAIDVAIVLVVWFTLRAALMGTATPRGLAQGTFLIAYYSAGNGLGGTVGARVTKIRVVIRDGSRPGILRGVARHLMSYLSGVTVFGYLSQRWDEGGQTWHDHAAGTYVVQHQNQKTPDATLAAAQVLPSRSEPERLATSAAAEIFPSFAEPQAQARPVLPRGEHEPGCTRKHSPRQRCITADEP